MALTEKSFNQVKNILNRLDRSIDDLRARRGTVKPAAPSQNPVNPADRRPNGQPNPAPQQSHHGHTNGNGQTNGNGHPPAPARPGAQFGKATPILPKHG